MWALWGDMRRRCTLIRLLITMYLECVIRCRPNGIEST
jgi:hypothetical protein